MKHIIWSSTFLIACLLGACSSEKDVTCDVTWKAQDDSELGRGEIVYEGLDDVDAGLEMCKEDEMDHEDRPTDSVSFACSCST
ncbi:hypothetical protein [Enhygromyxa salina]|uniref:Lipoprotein n=1 Tax=Enhygromyxa salina TaxID=215803 RepID=A0A2S9Y7R4_9BACT|nr:hypothetical protein [Enhygromyxa salina]PRQ01137.1 hypothetical protein ENSA7_57420 [Enhygromyxa salina]